VVNVGDMLERWANGLFPATLPCLDEEMVATDQPS
jgi:hypothetical protein